MSTLGFLYSTMWAHVSVTPLLIGPCLLYVGHQANVRVPSTSRLDWSPFHVKRNVALIPLRWRAWPLYVVLLASLIPITALFEELIFRYPIHNVWSAVLLGGLAFGLVHLTMLASLRTCLYLAVVGLAFVGVYELMGFWAVVLVHASYNFSALGWDSAMKVLRPAPDPGLGVG